MGKTKILLLLLIFLVCSGDLFSQTKKFNIQTTFPSSVAVCGKSDSLVFEIRNISSSSVGNVFLTLKLTPGSYYQASSIKGNGVSEFNIGNLNAPVFKMNNFTLAGYQRFSVRISSSCDLQTFISKGSQAFIDLDFTYTGGTEAHQTGPVNVSIPNVLISNISNQIRNGYLGDKFTRETTIRNTGKGGAAGITFYRTNNNGLKVVSARVKDKYSGDSIISNLDSNDFKLVGNKDLYLDAGEEVKIIDSVTVVKCFNLTSIYNVRFGCGNTICNFSTKNAIVNLDPFIQNLSITATSTIDWCFDKSKPTYNSLTVINQCNKPINNASLNMFQSYSGGFYEYQISAVDTAGMIVKKGKHGAKINNSIMSLRYNNSGTYFSCLGNSPLGGFILNLGTMQVNDTIFISWKAFSCTPDVCNTTLTAHRWTYSAAFFDPCGSRYTTVENFGSGGGIQYVSAIPWIPTDIVAGVPDKLNFTVSSASFFPYTTKAKFAVRLNLESGIKHSLKSDDIKFTDINGNEWKPYKVSLGSNDIYAYFTSPSINIVKSELNIVIETDCKTGNPSGMKNYSVDILYQMDSTCSNATYFQLYCASGQIKVHCTKSCSNGGMLFKTFTVKRKNYGKPDNNNDGQADGSGSINFSKVKTNRSFLYDTISTFYSGQVLSSGSISIFFNGKLKTSVVNGNLLKPLVATLTIYRGGKVRYSCNKLPVSTYVSGTIRYCEIDMNSSAAKTAGCNMTNYFFLQQDSVVVNINYVYTTSVGYYSSDVLFDNKEFYISTTSNPTGSQKLQCDTFSGRHILLGNYFTNWYTDNYSSSSCSPVTLYQSYYFSAGNCCDNYAGGNPFPYEYRNFNYLDKMGAILPKGYTFSSAAIYYYYSAGTSNYAWKYASNLKPSNKNSDTLLFNLDTLFNATKGIFKRSDEGYQGTLVLNLIPTCKAAVNTYEPVKYLSYFKWPDAGVTDIISNYPDSLKYFHPSILLTAVNSVSISKKDTFTWDIIMSNTISGSSIDNVWLANALPQKAGIIAIKDLSTGNDLNNKNGIFKAGNLSSTSARSFRIYATSSNCKLDSFKLAVGWSCDKYPDSLEVFACKNLLSYVNLVLSPQPPLIISTLLEDTARTDVCTNRKYSAIIANVDEDNIYNLKLKVTIPPGTTFVDTGMYYSFPYSSKFSKLSKPVLVTGTTYEWSLSDSLSVLKNGLEKVSDSAKSRIMIQFLLETNCQITAGAFVSIMPDGRIGCGEPVRRIGFTGKPIKIKGVDNPYFTLVTLSPDSINLCQKSVGFKAKVIYLGPTNTLGNDSILLSLPIGFEPDTSSLSTIRIKGRGVVKEVNQEMRWSWAIPKGLLPGDSSMLDFKLFITAKAPACGNESFSMQAVTKKKAFCVKSNDSCDINVATGSYFKAFKLDRGEPVIRLIRAISTNAGDSGEMADISFSITNNKKSIDTSMNSIFNLVVDKNGNGKYDGTDLLVKQFTKTQGWLSKQMVNFSYKGFVKNSDVCKLLIVSDPGNCQCLGNSLPILTLQLKNAGRDTAFCSNYTVKIGLDSVKNYKYEWLPGDFLSSPFKSSSVYNKPNNSSSDKISTYFLKTSKPNGCSSYDTVVIRAKPFIYLPKLKDTTAICQGGSVQIGDTARGGKGILSFNWTPNISLTSNTKMVVKANPKASTRYYLTVSDQNNCSIKDSLYLRVVKLPAVLIGHKGFCEKKDIFFTDESNYFGAKKETALWRINFNNVSQTDPAFAFDTIGFYFVRLIVSNEFGCTDSNYKYIHVYGNPVVANTKMNQCLGDTVTLIDNSIVAKMKIKSVTWRFANDSLKGKTASKIFNKPGNQYFNQIVESDSGCITSLYDSVLIIDKPVADFYRSGKCISDSVDLIDISKLNNSDTISEYRWTIGSSVVFSGKARILFDTAGTHTISLKIKTWKGCSDSVVKNIVINPVPSVSFSVDDKCPYDTVRAVNTSVISKGKIKNNSWEIPNIYQSGLANAVIYPVKEGTYSIKLKVKSDSLCQDSLEKLFTVYPGLKPKTYFLQGCANGVMPMADITIRGNATIKNRLWQIGMNNYTDSAFTLPLINAGSYPYRFVVTTMDDCIFSLDSTYEVFEKPIADFTSQSPCNNEELVFTDNSAAGARATIVSRQWFDNGLPINTNKVFTKSFTPGVLNISLMVQNSFGCVDSIAMPTPVSPSNFADFTYNDACPEDTVTVKFTGNSGSNAISNYDLSWGDGNTSQLLPAHHRYAKSGNYKIKLSIQTLPGCDFDTVKTVTIFPQPTAGFDYYPFYPDVKNPDVTITDRSKGAIKWYYTFGDSSSSILQNPTNSYRDSGGYTIAQMVENQFGCSDFTSKQVYVNFILFTHIPNAFSPGNDDINPLFAPTGLGIKDFKLMIFNRWGEKIFDPGWGRKAWDGTYLGEFVQTGLYPFYIEVLDFGNISHNYNGIVNVIR